jgi:UDP-N-acetylmuramoyl-L-alanyl-D-glutamate--2,6-diaminopimelate ligase
MNAMLPINALNPEILLRQLAKEGAQITVDTRALNNGDIMMAYPVGNSNQQSDNRSYIATALALGAAAVLYEPENLSSDLAAISEDERCIPVPGLAKKAGTIAADWYGHPSQFMRVIGVTGTNGKTSVAQWIAQGLDLKTSPSAIVGTLGAGLYQDQKFTGYTTPDAPRLQTLLKDLKQQGAKVVAMEVSSHALDQGRVNGTMFDTVVITNLTQDHLDYHGSMSDYALAKKKIMAVSGIKNIVINADDQFGQECLLELSKSLSDAGVNIWAYATQAEKLLALPCFPRNQLKKILASNIQTQSSGMSFECLLDGESLGVINVQSLGLFNVSNMLAVAAVLLSGDLEKAQLKPILQSLTPVKGRMELVFGKSEQAPLAVVDFAHTPDALEKTLKVLHDLAIKRSGDIWCVFGCGGDRDRLKRPIMGRIAEQYATHVMLTSDNPRTESPEQIIAEILSGIEYPEDVLVNTDRATAILQVIRQAKTQDIVLVAGKGHEETQEVAGKKHPFSDQLHLQLAMGGAAV